MMRDLFQWPHDLMAPSNADFVGAGIALLLAAAAIAAGWLIGRRFGDSVASFWAARTGSPDTGLAPRMCAVIQRGSTALLLELIVEVEHWRPLAALVLGVIEATTVAMFAVAVLRGLRLPRWAAWTMAALAFGATIARARRDRSAA